MTPSTEIDPIVLELMRNRWKGIADEMCAALVRTAYSTNIKDRRDCSAAVALPSGEILAQAEVGTPLHLGHLPAVVRAILRAFPLAEMQPGDCFITNLPYPEGPGHLPDVSMVSAVFHEGRAVALAATTAHHVDLGGFAPGSMPLGVTEIYQEGLQIPPIRILAGGEMREDLLALINQNCRTRLEVRGDLMAQVAAARIADQRIAELLSRTPLAEAQRYMAAILDHAEACMRAGIRALPDGVYRFTDYLDDDGIDDTPIPIAVTLTIADDALVCDFTGTGDQVLGPLNCRVAAACAAVYYVMKAVIDPDLPANAGAHRAVTVTAPEGSLLNAHYPAAIGNANILTDQRIVDVLLGALYQACPDRVCAACSGEMNMLNIGGVDSRPGRGAYYNYVETYAGGQGAHHDLDGADGVHTHLTNTRNAAVETIERTYPLQVTEYGLIPNSEGPGRQRGGCGMVRELLCLADRTTVNIGADRRRFLPWGLETEHHARGAHCYLIAADGTRSELPTKVHVTLRRGDRLRIETPGGGGWGDPADRDPAALAQDVADGLISADRAAAIYGAASG